MRFHDLRHEKTNRLFEKGLNPAEISTITGHKDTKMLMGLSAFKSRGFGGKIGSEIRLQNKGFKQFRNSRRPKDSIQSYTGQHNLEDDGDRL